MHDLFEQVLKNRDLSRAGDLFSIEDQKIVGDLSQVLVKIQEIASASDFLHSDNIQSVVEICITRVTSAIRDTGTIEQHVNALVSLLESCLNHDLRPSSKDEDPPHAKIASDIVSCIFLNHSKKSVMKLALPVAVKFLHRGNKELSRNLSSYLSLAAINNAELLSPHVQPIIDSVISGNYSLTRVLPQIYAVKKEPIHDHIMALVSLLPLCESSEKLSLLALFELVAKHKPSLLEGNLPQLSECLASTSTAGAVLQIFLDMAAVRPLPFTEHLKKMKAAAEAQPAVLSMVAHIMGIIGKLSLERGIECLDFLISQLGKADHNSLVTLLREIKSITDTFPALLPRFLPQICSKVEPGASSTTRFYLQQLKQDYGIVHRQQIINQTPGGVTIVKVGGGNSRQDLVTATSNTHSNLLKQGMKDSRTSFAALKHMGSQEGARSMTHLGSSQLVHRSMSRLPSVQGHQSTSRLSSPTGPHHMSMTRLSSSTGMNRSMTALSSRHNLSIHTNRISSCGVTVTTSTTPHKSISGSIPTLLEEASPVMTVSIISSIPQSIPESSIHTQSRSSILHPSPPPSISPQESLRPPSVTPVPTSAAASPTPHSSPKLRHNHHNHNNNNNSINNGNNNNVVVSQSPQNQRISVFEPYPMRDAIQHFCEKHLDKIKAYMQKVFVKIPLPAKCTIEERKAKKHAKLHFACQGKGEHCLYLKTMFVMKTRNPRIWIHLMFLALQARASSALSTRETSVSSLKNCWDTLKYDNKSFLTLVTSSFPSAKDQDNLISELRYERFFDVFEYNGPLTLWGCFLCNHPDRAQGFLRETGEPVIEGHLKEKKGKWKLFRRWRTRYFTLSGAHLSYRGMKDDKEAQPIEVSQIRSVRPISSRGRNIPKAFEIFTSEKTFVLKAKDSKNTEQWVQCLSIALARSHAKETSH